MPIEFHHQPGLVAYLTIGDPDLATSKRIALAAIDAGADVLELGVPFSDPLADGPVIQRASERAVRNGTRLQDVLALASSLRKARPGVGLVVFSYLNPILRMGLEKFAAAAEKAGHMYTDTDIAYKSSSNVLVPDGGSAGLSFQEQGR